MCVCVCVLRTRVCARECVRLPAFFRDTKCYRNIYLHNG